MTRIPEFVALSISFVFSVSAAYGQGNCSINTIVGSYAFGISGSSAVVTGASPDPQDPLHWTALYGPIAGVGIMTVRSSFPRPGGTGDGYYWMTAGRMDLGDPANSIPLHATLTVNPDCTGRMTYAFGPYTLVEQLVILDNGSEVRSLSVQTAMPTANWISVWRRVTGTCSQAKITGSYLYSCKSVVAADATTMVAGAALIRETIAGGGTTSGAFTAKVASTVLADVPFTGTMKVSDDCTALSTQTVPGIGTDSLRSVFFNEGRDGFALFLKSASEPFAFCEIRQIANR